MLTIRKKSLRESKLDDEQISLLLKRYEQEPELFVQKAEEDPASEEAQLLSLLARDQSVISKEAQTLNDKLELALKKLFVEFGLSAEEGLKIATDDHDNRKREKLRAFLSKTNHPEAKDFLNFAIWINQPGVDGLRNIFKTFRVDAEGNVSPKRSYSTLLKNVISLAIKLAAHSDWVGRVGFVRGATLRLDPYDLETPFNSRHAYKLDVIQHTYQKMTNRYPERFRSNLYQGEDPEVVFWHGFIETLQEWTDSIQVALQGASWVLRRNYAKQSVQWEAQYLRAAEDLVHQALLDDGYKAIEVLDQIFSVETRTHNFYVPGSSLPKQLTGNRRAYDTILDAIDDLSIPERSVLRIWFYRRVYTLLKAEHREHLDRAMTWLSALMVENEFHYSGNTDLSQDFNKVWPGFIQVRNLMEECWETVSRYVQIIKRHYKNPMIRELLSTQDVDRIENGLPPALINQDFRKLYDLLLNTALDEADRQFLLKFKEHPWMKSNVYLYTDEGVASPKYLIYFLAATYQIGSQRSWFNSIAILKEVVKTAVSDPSLV